MIWRLIAVALFGIASIAGPVAAALADPDGPQRRFTLQRPAAGEYGVAEHKGEPWICIGDECLMPVSQLRIAGLHNLSNALAALALGDAMKLPRQSMIETLREFRGLLEWPAEGAVPHVARPVEPSEQALVEPLSPRELEVLHLIALGKTNKQIARQLIVAPGTVKANTSSIYGKLDVANRTEAVARARQLGLLP